MKGLNPFLKKSGIRNCSELLYFPVRLTFLPLSCAGSGGDRGGQTLPPLEQQPVPAELLQNHRFPRGDSLQLQQPRHLAENLNLVGQPRL